VLGVAATADFEWSALMRPAWQGSALFVRGYVTLRADQTGFAPNPRILDLGETRVAFFFGHIKYLRTSEKLLVRVRRKRPTDGPGTTDPAIDLQRTPGVWERTDAGFYTLVATPASATQPSEAVARVEECVGLLTAFESTRFVLDQLFEIEVRPGPPDQLSASSGWFLVPHEVKEADLGDERLAVIEGARSTIETFDEKKKNRILLSLRWLENGVARTGNSSGIDTFLAYWIALEALAMPTTTNTGPLEQTLASIYGGDAEAAKTRFLTKKLHRLRSAIVHGGKRVAVTPAILRYLEFLYVDILFHEVGVPSEHRAASVLATSSVQQDLSALQQ
jgi:hypothetical protein